jgi:murein DD-endopeptidase MepM/ murein hydrolase activator NlpD
MRPIVDKYKNLKSLGNVTTPYGGKTNYEQFHPGVDVANEKGTPIPAFVEGTVEKTTTGSQNGDVGFGNTVVIRDPAGSKHQLGHLDQVGVRPGQQVQKGQVVGSMGNSGSSYSKSGLGDGTHLDYRIVTAYGKYKNPFTYLNQFNKKRYGK